MNSERHRLSMYWLKKFHMDINLLDPELTNISCMCKQIRQSVEQIYREVDILNIEHTENRVTQLKTMMKELSTSLHMFIGSVYQLDILPSPTVISNEDNPPNETNDTVGDDLVSDEIIEIDDDLNETIETIEPISDTINETNNTVYETIESNVSNEFDNEEYQSRFSFLKKNYTCPICMDTFNAYKFAFPSCDINHACCINCVEKMVIKKCPICRSTMEECTSYIAAQNEYIDYPITVGSKSSIPPIEEDPFYNVETISIESDSESTVSLYAPSESSFISTSTRRVVRRTYRNRHRRQQY